MYLPPAFSAGFAVAGVFSLTGLPSSPSTSFAFCLGLEFPNPRSSSSELSVPGEDACRELGFDSKIKDWLSINEMNPSELACAMLFSGGKNVAAVGVCAASSLEPHQPEAVPATGVSKLSDDLITSA